LEHTGSQWIGKLGGVLEPPVPAHQPWKCHHWPRAARAEPAFVAGDVEDVEYVDDPSDDQSDKSVETPHVTGRRTNVPGVEMSGALPRPSPTPARRTASTVLASDVSQRIVDLGNMSLVDKNAFLVQLSASLATQNSASVVPAAGQVCSPAVVRDLRSSFLAARSLPSRCHH
jgi:hypothetical protein